MGSGATLSLHEAAEKGDLEQVQRHLNAGSNIDALDRDKMSPLHYASFRGQMEIAELLIDKGANVNIKGQEGGVTPLHLAATKGNKEMVKLLISRGADVELTDKYGRKPLHYAKSFNQYAVMEILLQYEANN